jgi:hypothetical protein
MNPPDEDNIRNEAAAELRKEADQLAADIIREANTHPEKPEGEKENLDIIKHLLKRIALHQLTIDAQGKRTNRILIWLSIIMAIGSLFTVLQFFFGK